MTTRTRRSPSKAATAVAVLDPFAELVEPEVLPTVAALPDPDKVPESLRARVEIAYAMWQDRGAKTPWTTQLCPSETVTAAAVKGMTDYAKGRADGRLTLRTKAVDGGFKYKATDYTPRSVE